MSASAVVLGARNLGGAIATHLQTAGWSVAAVARSDDSLAGVRSQGVLGLNADAGDPDALRAVLDDAASRHQGLDLVVNAVAAARPTGGPWGGGPIAEASPDAFDAWAAAVARQAFTFLSVGAAALRAQGRGGTLVQVTGGSARRAMPGRGLWAAGAAATRALTQAAAQELRGEGIHVALLVVDATIASPKTADRTRDVPADALADQEEIARAVAYLAGQEATGFTHELVVTPGGERWVP
jgi:NAD(P)-dependent dehydrogenase (short-subunit alcohol dehydrogenase family)